MSTTVARGLLVALAVAACASVARSQDERGEALVTVEDGLASLRSGQPLAGRVPPEVATAAVARIEAATPPADLRALAAIAVAGSAQRSLVERLVRLASGGGPAASTLEVLRTLPPDLLDEAVASSRATWDAKLLELVAADDARARPALALLARDAEPQVLVACLATTTTAHRLQLLRALKTSRRPGAVLEALARLELDPELFEPFCTAVSALVARDDATAERALGLAAQGTWGWGSAVLRALGSVPPTSPALRDRAERFVLHALETAEGYHLAAAVLAGTRLRLPELRPLLAHLARDPDSRDVRVAAIRAIPLLSQRDPETLDLLIELLDDPDVAKEAHRALLRTSGVRLPLSREPWLAWRARELSVPATPVAAPAAVDEPAAAPAAVPHVTAVESPGGAPVWLPAAFAGLVLAAVAGWMLVVAIGARARAVGPVPTPPTPEPQEVVVSAAASRLERLRANLDRDIAAAVSDESQAQVSLLREALRADLLEEPPAPAAANPDGLLPVDALRELLRLGRQLEGPPLETPFEAFQAAVDRLERSLPGGGFTELGRESCFLLLQVAHLLSRGRSVDRALQARWLAVLQDMATHLGGDPRTMDVGAAFPELGGGAPAPPPPPAHEGPTIDVAAHLEASDAPRVDPPTLDVSDAFPTSPAPGAPPSSRPEAPTLDVAEAFAEDLGTR